MRGFARLLERVSPWLIEMGSWLFGAMIAFNLLVFAALLAVGPADRAVLVATAALALALPPHITGLFLLRLVVDMQRVGLEEAASQSFLEVGFSEAKTSSEEVASIRSRRLKTALGYSYLLLAISLLLVVTGMTAALWHLAWWIAVVFLSSVVLSQGVLIHATSTRPAMKPTSSSPQRID